MILDVGFDGLALQVDIQGRNVGDHLHSGYKCGFPFRRQQAGDEGVEPLQFRRLVFVLD